MNKEEAKELHRLLLTFIGLLHKKYLLKLRKQSSFYPRANKNQVKIMNILYHRNNLTPTEIGRMLDIEKGSLTTILDQLEEMDFIVRAVDPADRRRLLLSLSDTGREQMEKAMAGYTECLIGLFQDVNPEETSRFIGSLRYAIEFMRKL